MNELIAHPTKTFAILAATIGAISLLASVIRKDKRIRTEWARYATVLAAVLILIWCAGTLWLVIRGPVISPNVVSAIMVLKTAIGCIGGGILITLFISRSFTWRLPPESEKPQ
jgi:hypothetical protein